MREVTRLTGTVRELSALPSYGTAPMYGLAVQVRGEKDEQGDRFDATVQIPLHQVPVDLKVGAQVMVTLHLPEPGTVYEPGIGAVLRADDDRLRG